MSVVKSFRDLSVWQKSVQLCLLLYQLTQRFPREEMYGLSSQLRRAGVSVASNVAEGFGRRSRSEFRSFLCIARGSVLEIQTQLVIAGELGFGDSKQLAEAGRMSDEVSRMLWSLMEKMGRRAAKEASGD